MAKDTIFVLRHNMSLIEASAPIRQSVRITLEELCQKVKEERRIQTISLS